MLQILLHQVGQRVVVDDIGIRSHLLNLHGRPGNQGRTFGDVAHPLVKLLHLRHLRRTDGIKNLSLRRDDVGRDAAGIGNSAMDPRLVDHVLAHVVDADIHDFNGI